MTDCCSQSGRKKGSRKPLSKIVDLKNFLNDMICVSVLSILYVYVFVSRYVYACVCYACCCSSVLRTPSRSESRQEH